MRSMFACHRCHISKLALIKARQLEFSPSVDGNSQKKDQMWCVYCAEREKVSSIDQTQSYRRRCDLLLRLASPVQFLPSH